GRRRARRGHVSGRAAGRGDAEPRIAIAAEDRDVMRALAAGVVAAAVLSPAVPAFAAATTVLDLGGARVYVRSDAVAPLASVALFVRAGLDRQTSDQNGLA